MVNDFDDNEIASAPTTTAEETESAIVPPATGLIDNSNEDDGGYNDKSNVTNPYNINPSNRTDSFQSSSLMISDDEENDLTHNNNNNEQIIEMTKTPPMRNTRNPQDEQYQSQEQEKQHQQQQIHPSTPLSTKSKQSTIIGSANSNNNSSRPSSRVNSTSSQRSTISNINNKNELELQIPLIGAVSDEGGIGATEPVVPSTPPRQPTSTLRKVKSLFRSRNRQQQENFHNSDVSSHSSKSRRQHQHHQHNNNLRHRSRRHNFLRGEQQQHRYNPFKRSCNVITRSVPCLQKEFIYPCFSSKEQQKSVCKNTIQLMNLMARILFWFSVIILAMFVVWYSFELKKHGKDPHLIAWFSAGAFVLLGFPISMWGIVMHLANYNQPNIQCYIVRILWMVPIYSLESWLSLRFHTYAIYITTARDCYEAYVLYNFFQFLIQVLGGETDLILMLKDKSPTRGAHMWGLQFCLKPWLMGQPVSSYVIKYNDNGNNTNNDKVSTKEALSPPPPLQQEHGPPPSPSQASIVKTASEDTDTKNIMTSTNVGNGIVVLEGHTSNITTASATKQSLPNTNNNKMRQKHRSIKRVRWTSPFYIKSKFGVLQYVLLKVVLSLLTMILEMAGLYKEGDFTPKGGYLYICILTNLSQCWALYCLIIFYFATKNELSPIRPVGKFLSVKAIVFFTWWQSVMIAIATSLNLIPHYSDDWTSEDVSRGLQDYFICIEMFIFAIVHTFVFPHTDYLAAAVASRQRMKQSYASGGKHLHKRLGRKHHHGNHYNSLLMVREDQSVCTKDSALTPIDNISTSTSDYALNDMMETGDIISSSGDIGGIGLGIARYPTSSSEPNSPMPSYLDRKDSNEHLTTLNEEQQQRRHQRSMSGNDLHYNTVGEQIGLSVEDENAYVSSTDDDNGNTDDEYAQQQGRNNNFCNINQYDSEDGDQSYDDDDDADNREDDYYDDEYDDDDDEYNISENDEYIFSPQATIRKQNPGFVRALLDSTIPRDVMSSTVGIVKGDYNVEKKTLLHHATTSDNYDLFSSSSKNRRRRMVHRYITGGGGTTTTGSILSDKNSDSNSYSDDGRQHAGEVIDDDQMQLLKDKEKLVQPPRSQSNNYQHQQHGSGGVVLGGTSAITPSGYISNRNTIKSSRVAASSMSTTETNVQNDTPGLAESIASFFTSSSSTAGGISSITSGPTTIAGTNTTSSSTVAKIGNKKSDKEQH